MMNNDIENNTNNTHNTNNTNSTNGIYNKNQINDEENNVKNNDANHCFTMYYYNIYETMITNYETCNFIIENASNFLKRAFDIRRNATYFLKYVKKKYIHPYWPCYGLTFMIISCPLLFERLNYLVHEYKNMQQCGIYHIILWWIFLSILVVVMFNMWLWFISPFHEFEFTVKITNIFDVCKKKENGKNEIYVDVMLISTFICAILLCSCSYYIYLLDCKEKRFNKYNNNYDDKNVNYCKYWLEDAPPPLYYFFTVILLTLIINFTYSFFIILHYYDNYENTNNEEKTYYNCAQQICKKIISSLEIIISTIIFIILMVSIFMFEIPMAIVIISFIPFVLIYDRINDM